MATYTIKSVKHTEQFKGTLIAAIERAKAVEAEYQPAFGTQIEGSEGATIWDSEDQIDGAEAT